MEKGITQTEEEAIVELLLKNGFRELSEEETKSDRYRKSFENIEVEPEHAVNCIID